MANRSRFKNVKIHTEVEAEFEPLPEWTCGDDLPFTFKRKELFKLAKKTIRQNFKRGAIDRGTMQRLIRHERDKYRRK